VNSVDTLEDLKFDMPEPGELNSLEEVIERYAPELVPKKLDLVESLLAAFRTDTFPAALVMILVVSMFGAMANPYISTLGMFMMITFKIMSYMGIVAWSLGSLIIWSTSSDERKSFESDLFSNPMRLQQKLVELYRSKIESWKISVLGDKSDIAKTRSALNIAHQEAITVAAYWRERQKSGDETGLVSEQLELAEMYVQKFQDALASNDRRMESLRTLISKYEARLSILARGPSDHEYSLRLAKLGADGSDLIAKAEQAVRKLAYDCVHDMARFAGAIGGFERLQIKESAARLPLDKIEVVADKILASANEDEKLIGDLVAAVS
jgi:hypothetical protein